MAKIRIGNDLQIAWEVTTAGKAASLEGHALRLYVVNAYRKVEITDYTVSGDVITFRFLASQQKQLGVHCVQLVDTTDSAVKTVCADQAFTLVGHTSEEADDESAYDGFNDYLVSLRSNLLVGRPGQSAYEIWLGLGHTGTEADFMDWIKKAAVDAAADVSKLIPEVQEATTAANKAKDTAEQAATKANEAVEKVGTAMTTVEELEAKAKDALATAETATEKSDAATARATTAAENAENAATTFYNVTNEVPLTEGYYTLTNQDDETRSAVAVAAKNNKKAGGLFLSFKADAQTWKHYQYIGKTTDDVNWYNASNWSDLADLAPGTQAVVIVDNVCGKSETGYTLATAVTALLALQNSTGTAYIKHGTVISYTTSDGRMETKQFTGTDSTISDVTLWRNYGGDRNVVLTQSEYDAMVEAGTLDDDVYYNVLEE